VEVKVDFRRYLLAIKKNIWKIGIVTLISFFVALFLNYRVKDNEYTASADVYGAAFGSYSESIEGVTALKTYADIIKSKKVADKAAKYIEEDESSEHIDGEMVKDMITYSFDETSPIYRIEATSSSPSLSMSVANAVAKAFVDQMNTITGDGSAQILDEAYKYEKSFDGKKSQLLNIIIITLAGFFVSVLAVIIYSFFSKKVMSVHDATLNGELEIIGVIPNFDIE